MSILKKINIIILTLLLMPFTAFSSHYNEIILEEGLPIINSIDEKDVLPGGFRMSRVIRLPSEAEINLEGLSDLNISGSSQFSELSLDTLLKKINRKNVTIVNLRQEDGGFLEPQEGVGAISFSYLMSMPWWTGENPAGNRTVEEIEASEQNKMDQIKKGHNFTVYAVKDSYAPKDNHQILYKIDVVVKRALTEKQLVQEKGLNYFRLPDKKFGHMEFAHVQDFVDFVKNLPADEWVHFHCKKGQSRTTLFMAMYDIMRNGDKVSTEDIIKRQGPLGLGGADLFKLSPDSWDYSFKKGWVDFLYQFHDYVQENKATNFQKSWSEYAIEKGIEEKPKVVLGDYYKCTTATSLLPNENASSTDNRVLVINSLNESKLSLSNFRTTQDLFLDREMTFNKSGLQDFYASGSNQYSIEGLKLFLDKARLSGKKMIVVDLRHDDHLFINGLNVSTFESKEALLNPRSPEDILMAEEVLKMSLEKQKKLTLHAIDTKYPKNEFDDRFQVTLRPNEVKTPKEVVTELGAEYLLIGCKRFSDTSDEDVDHFISYFKSQPKDTWYHFHCKKGKSRTTLFLTMLDMMHNANQVSMEDILERQKVIGGSDLRDITPKDPSWAHEKEAKKQWIVFLARFYTYCQENPNFETSWTEWSASHPTYQPNIDYLCICKN